MVGIRRVRQRPRPSPIPRLVTGIIVFVFIFSVFRSLGRYGPASELDGGAIMYPAHGQVATNFTIMEGKKFSGTAQVISSETNHHAWNVEDCAAACARASGCQWFEYCADPNGCSEGTHVYRECWLLAGGIDRFLGDSHQEPGWMSGVRKMDLANHTASILKQTQTKPWLGGSNPPQKYHSHNAKEEGAFAELGNASLPLVYLDIDIAGKSIGRVVIQLFPDISPNQAENFRLLCTGEGGKGLVPNPVHFKGSTVNLIVEDAFIQAGIQGGQSAFGVPVPLDPGGLALKHDRKGLLTSVADAGQDIADAEFWILMAPNPSLDGKHAVFGEVLIGLEVLEALNGLAHGKEGHNVTSAATIQDSGQIRNGTVHPELSQVTTEDTINEGGSNRNSRVMPEHRELRLNESLPLVYFDVEIKGELIGRIEVVLFTDTSPRHAENFRQLCTGEAGAVKNPRPGGPDTYFFKGAKFYRIVTDWINQAGIDTDSVWGGTFADDPGGLALKHDRQGLLSSANRGPNTNEGHFSILMGPSPHLDGHYTIFGQVVAGWEVCEAINALSKGKPDKLATAEAGAVIGASGQLRRGRLKPDLLAGLPANATGYNLP